jgi:hypothetical protein
MEEARSSLVHKLLLHMDDENEAFRELVRMLLQLGVGGSGNRPEPKGQTGDLEADQKP